MIGLKGRMNVIDNSGALVAECINVLKVKTRKKSTGFATVGDEVVCVINRARPISQVPNFAAASSNIQKVRRGDVRRAVVVRTKKPVMRADGRVVRCVPDLLAPVAAQLMARFDDNACVLVNNKSEMVGTRISGVVASELRDAPGGTGEGGRWAKILSLAPKTFT